MEILVARKLTIRRDQLRHVSDDPPNRRLLTNNVVARDVCRTRGCGRSVVSILIKVDFPAPLRPRSPKISPPVQTSYVIHRCQISEAASDSIRPKIVTIFASFPWTASIFCAITPKSFRLSLYRPLKTRRQ